MWHRVYEGSELEVEVTGRKGRLKMRAFPADPASCGRITGWFEFIAEKTGARATHTCRCDGAADCAWDFAW